MASGHGGKVTYLACVAGRILSECGTGMAAAAGKNGRFQGPATHAGGDQGWCWSQLVL
jgi:hypothetical protein